MTQPAISTNHLRPELTSRRFFPPSRLGNRSKVALGEERPYYDYLPEIMGSYSKAVAMHGGGASRYAQQALPRLLTLYCEYGTDSLSRRSMSSKERTAATMVGVGHVCGSFTIFQSATLSLQKAISADC